MESTNDFMSNTKTPPNGYETKSCGNS